MSDDFNDDDVFGSFDGDDETSKIELNSTPSKQQKVEPAPEDIDAEFGNYKSSLGGESNEKIEQKKKNEEAPVTKKEPVSQPKQKKEIVVAPKRHLKRHKYSSDTLNGLTRPAIRRLCRRAGVVRISGTIYDNIRLRAKVYLENIIHRSLFYMEHARRKTLSVPDVACTLKIMGQAVYGYN